jgi:translation initiation factor eIF-2B subunit delta
MSRKVDERAAIIARIRDDNRRGASELARDAVAALEEFAATVTCNVLMETRALAHELAGLRPTLCAISDLLGHCLEELEDEVGKPSAIVERAVERTLSWSNEATERTVTRAVEVLRGAAVIMTHSRSSTVQAALARLAPPTRVIATESRPGFEGHDLARQLAERGAQVDVITEAEIGLVVSEADAVLVGADAILRDGSVVNKVGTHGLALAAREYQIPFYVCAESFKLSASTTFSNEEHDPAELEAPTHPGIRPRNFYFESIPAGLISMYLSDIAIENEIELAPKRR